MSYEHRKLRLNQTPRCFTLPSGVCEMMAGINSAGGGVLTGLCGLLSGTEYFEVLYKYTHVRRLCTAPFVIITASASVNTCAYMRYCFAQYIETGSTSKVATAEGGACRVLCRHHGTPQPSLQVPRWYRRKYSRANGACVSKDATCMKSRSAP